MQTNSLSCETLNEYFGVLVWTSQLYEKRLSDHDDLLIKIFFMLSS